MLRTTKLTLAAMLLAGSYGFAVAQGAESGGVSDSGGVATDKPANRDTLDTTKKQQRELQGAPARMKGSDAKMQQQRGADTPANAGPDETGTAKDTAGSGTQRSPAKQQQ